MARFPLALDEHGHAAALEVEGDLVHLLHRMVHVEGFPQIRMIQDRLVHLVAQARLVVAVVEGQLQHPLVLAAFQVHVFFQEDPVLGQGAGLVGAEDVHGAEVLDGPQPLHDDLVAGHGHGPLGKVRGHDHREHLRREPHGHGHREEERLHPVMLGDAVDGKHRGHHDQHEADHQPTDFVHPQVEVGLDSLPDHTTGQGAEVGVAACGNHHGDGGAAHHVGAHKADVG